MSFAIESLPNVKSCWASRNYHTFFLFSGFWQKIDYYREQPEVHFKHELLVLMQTDDPRGSIGWSSYKNYNEFLGDNTRIPLIKVSFYPNQIIYKPKSTIVLSQSSETDWNRDGKLDSLSLKLEMPLRADENVYSVDLFLFFDVKLHVSYNFLQGLPTLHEELHV